SEGPALRSPQWHAAHARASPRRRRSHRAVTLGLRGPGQGAVHRCGQRDTVGLMSTTDSPLSCPACRVIDQADGVEDGNLFKLEHYQTRDERRLLDALMRAQDRAADEITSFAGSLNFVYIHSAWFGVWILLNVGIVGASLKFDKFPFGLLTMIVSL